MDFAGVVRKVILLYGILIPQHRHIDTDIYTDTGRHKNTRTKTVLSIQPHDTNLNAS